MGMVKLGSYVPLRVTLVPGIALEQIMKALLTAIQQGKEQELTRIYKLNVSN